MKQKKAIVFFSAGLGDAVLLIPLVKQLKQQGFFVAGFFNSIQPCEEIFTQINLLDEIIVKKSKFNQFVFSFTNLFKYDKAFINYFATNHVNLLTASLLAKKVFTNKKVDSFLVKLFQSKIKYIEPIKNIHDGQQNLNLLQDNSPISVQDFYINFPSTKNDILPKPFIAVQVSAGNNKISYKNWPVNYWIDFLKLVLQQYPDKKIILLGDENEVNLSAKITSKLNQNVISFIGKTSVTEVMNIINQADFFIGLDGGLMHLAVALQKPTFTIWGASSITLYGYEQFSNLHKCVSLNLACNPCNSWINPNHTKTNNPSTCPDYACLQQLLPQDVFNQFTQYVNLLPTYAH
ncbi:MAG: glycosyltransferase family 9 protein [Bacteroidia bacterium]